LKGEIEMDTNEIMVNGEIIEMTEEIATAGSRKGIKVAVGVGLAVLGGVAAYKYIIKPMVAKIKAKKEQQRMDAEFDEFKDDGDE
jgi:malate synthase